MITALFYFAFPSIFSESFVDCHFMLTYRRFLHKCSNLKWRYSVIPFEVFFSERQPIGVIQFFKMLNLAMRSYSSYTSFLGFEQLSNYFKNINYL